MPASNPAMARKKSPDNALKNMAGYCQLKVQLFGVQMQGATRGIYDDLAKTNEILSQCGVQVELKGALSGPSYQSLGINVTQNKFDIPASTTASASLKQLLKYRPGGSAIHVYYVKGDTDVMDAAAVARSRFSPPLPDSVVMSHVAVRKPATLAHELVHVLTNYGGHENNKKDKDHLMAAGRIASGKSALTLPWCQRMARWVNANATCQ